MFNPSNKEDKLTFTSMPCLKLPLTEHIQENLNEPEPTIEGVQEVI